MSRRKTKPIPQNAGHLAAVLSMFGADAVLGTEPLTVGPWAPRGISRDRVWNVLMTMALSANEDDVVWLGAAETARRAGLVENRAYEARAALESAGVIRRIGKVGRAVKYQIVRPEVDHRTSNVHAHAGTLEESGNDQYPRARGDISPNIPAHAGTLEESGNDQYPRARGDISPNVPAQFPAYAGINGVLTDGNDGRTPALTRPADAGAPRLPEDVADVIDESLSWTGWNRTSRELAEAWAAAVANGATTAHLRAILAGLKEPNDIRPTSRAKFLATHVRSQLADADPAGITLPPREVPAGVQTSIETFAKNHGGAADAALAALGRFPADVDLESGELDDIALCLLVGEACVSIEADWRAVVNPGEGPLFPDRLLDAAALGPGWTIRDDDSLVTEDPIARDRALAVLACVLRGLAAVWDEWAADQ